MRNRTAHVLGNLLPRSILLTTAPVRPDDRRVALTFDDGPDPMTPAYLDELDRLGVCATFFVLGRSCPLFPGYVTEMVRRGHEVVSHGYSHRRFPLMTRGELWRELERTAAVLPPAARRRPLLRPPGGHVTGRSIGWCALAGYTTALWSIDSEDYREKDPEKIARAAIPDDMRPGEIILLHEGQSWTLQALPRICERASERGFRLCTINELLAAPGSPSA